jgi:DNA polymerase-3 subunit chi
MTRIDFYQLNPQQHNQDRVVCQLCQKAYDSNHKSLLLTQNPEQTAHLDLQLWIFDDDSFIPHDAHLDGDVNGESGSFLSPILIHDQPNPQGERQLLINLSPTIPSYFAQFERVIELVTEDNKQSAREHYSFYKERGYPLNHHTL